MIVKDDGLRYAKLIHVSVDNGKTEQSNKFYIMEELDNGTIKCTYGRVGAAKPAVSMKKSHEWDKIYSQKTSARKGYVDKTDEAVIKESKSSGLVDIAELEVKKLFEDLMDYANKTIGANYKVTQDDVTQKQIDNAQVIIDELFRIAKSNSKKADKIEPLNEKLLELYTTIPRKMKNVKDHLLNDTDFTLDEIKDFLANEQDLLDTMAGQVLAVAQTADSDDDADGDGQQDSLLDRLGLEVTVETDKESIKLVKKLLGNNADQMVTLYKVINKVTQKKFDNHYAKAKNKKRLLLFHGSRNQNWFNIIQTGLLIRPSCAQHTGSMWDDGIYYASDADKSLGYTDGGRWAGGYGNNTVYLGLFDVHLGNQLHKYKHDSSCYNISKEVKRDGYDSVHAHKGANLRKDEFIVYDSNKCTIAYVIEMKA